MRLVLSCLTVFTLFNTSDYTHQDLGSSPTPPPLQWVVSSRPLYLPDLRSHRHLSGVTPTCTGFHWFPSRTPAVDGSVREGRVSGSSIGYRSRQNRSPGSTRIPRSPRIRGTDSDGTSDRHPCCQRGLRRETGPHDGTGMRTHMYRPTLIGFLW